MENLTKLHKVLVRDGYMDLSFEDFIAKSADTDYQERVYEVVTRDGLYEGSRPDFNEQYFAELEVKKKDGSESIVDVEGTESTTDRPGELGFADSSAQPHQFEAGRRNRGQRSDVDFTGQFQAEEDVTADVAADVDADIGFLTDQQRRQQEIQKRKQQPVDTRTDREKMTPITAEKDTWIERTLGKNEFTDFFGDLYRAAETGMSQGGSVDDALELFGKGGSVTQQDVAEYIEAANRLNEAGVSDEMRSFNEIYEQEGGGIWGFIKGVASNPTVVPQLFTTSVTAMLNPASLTAAGLVSGGFITKGALGGAGIGSGAGGVGAAPGALAGALAGAVSSIPFAIGAAGGTLETGLAFSEFLQEEIANKGLEFNHAGVMSILTDPDVMFRIRSKAAGRGLTIGIIDRYASGLAGKAVRSIGKAGKAGKRTKLKQIGAGTGIEAVGGSVGEAAARGVVGQEMDVAEIGFEGIAGTATAPLSVGVGMLTTKSYPGEYKINGEVRTGEEVEKFILESPDKDFAGMKLRINDDPKLKALAEERKKKLKKKNKLIKELKPILKKASSETSNKIVELQMEMDEISENPSNSYIGKKRQQARLKKITAELKALMLNIDETTQPTQEVEVTNEEVMQRIKEEKGEDAVYTDEEFENIKKVLIKEKQDAIQKQSTEEVDVQELTEDGSEVGEGDTEGGTTVEGEGETEIGAQTEEEITPGGDDSPGGSVTRGWKSRGEQDPSVDPDTEQEVQDLEEFLGDEVTPGQPTPPTPPTPPTEPEVTMDEVLEELGVDPTDPDAIKQVTPEQIIETQDIIKKRKQAAQQQPDQQPTTDKIEAVEVDTETGGLKIQNTQTGQQVNFSGEQVVVDPSNPNESNLFVADETTVQIDPSYKNTQSQTKQESKITKLAQNAIKAIKKILPNTKIVLHKTEASYNAATNENSQGSTGGGGTRGLYNKTTNTIHINMPHATSRTIAHEVFHAIVMNNLSNPEIFALTAKMVTALKKSIKDPSILKELNDFTAKYKGVNAQFKNEEFVAEFIGILAENYQSMNTPSKNLVQRFLSRIGAILKISKPSIPKTSTDTQSLLNILAGKIQEGQQIEEVDIEFVKEGKKKPTKKTEVQKKPAKKTEPTKKPTKTKKTSEEFQKEIEELFVEQQLKELEDENAALEAQRALENEIQNLPNPLELFLFENLGKIHIKDYDLFGDPNYRKDFGLALNRLLRKTGKQDIDVVAMSLSEEWGTEITPQDIVDFLYDRAATPGKYTAKNAARARELGLYDRQQRFSPKENTQQKITQIAVQNGINQNGFFNANLFNPQALRKRLESFGYGLKAAYRSYGDRGLTGYYITQPNGRKWNLPQDQTRRQAMFDKRDDNVMDIINKARDNNFSRAAIREYLIKQKGLKAKEADAALNIELDNLYELPPSYGNIGLKSGLKLFKRISERANKLLNKNLTEQEALTQTLEYLEAQPEYQNATQDQKDQMYADTQKALGLKPTKDVGIKIRNLKRDVSQRKKGAKGLQEIKRKLRNYMRQVLPADVYKKSDVVKMIRKITNATEANIDMLMDEVTDFATTRQVKHLKSVIDNILNGKYETLQGGRKRGKKIDTKTKLRLENIRDNLVAPPNFTAEDIIKRNEALNDQYKELSEKVDLTPQQENLMIDILAALSINNAKLMLDTDIHKVESLQRTEDILAAMLGEGRQTYKQQLEESHNKYKEEFRKVYKSITGIDVDLDSPEGIQKMKDDARALKKRTDAKEARPKVIRYLSKLKTRLSNFFKSSESLMGLMEIIAAAPGEIFGGAAKKLVYDKINKSTIVFKARMLANRKMVLGKIKELYGKGWRGKMKRASASKIRSVDGKTIYTDQESVNNLQKEYDKNPTKENKKKLEKKKNEERIALSDNQIAYLWMQYQDPANRASFANPENSNFGPDHKRIMKQLLESTGAKVEINSKGELEVVESNAALDFAQWQVEEFFPSLYPHYDKTYQDIYRTNLPWNKHYGGRIYRQGIEPDPLDLLGDKQVLNKQVGAASTMARQKNNHPIEAIDQMDALMTYLTDMEWFAAYGSTIRDINKLFGNPTMRRTIIDTHGESTMRLIDHKIKDIAARGVNTSRGNGVVNWFTNLFIATRLGLNPTIMIKQLTSSFTYMNDIGPINYMKYAVKNKLQFLSVWKEIMKNSVYMQDRMTTDMRRTIEAYSQKREVKFMPSITTNWWANAMMFFVRVGDIGAIMLGGMPNYSYYKAQFKKKNPNATEQEAIQYAIEKFENDTKNTQQSMDLQDKDFYQSSHAITRSLNMFLTTPKQYLRKEFSGIRNMRRGIRDMYGGIKGKDRKLFLQAAKQFGGGFRTFLMYHAMMPALFQFVALGAPGLLRDLDEEDEEDMLRSVVLGNFNALFVVGDIVSGLADAVQEKPYAGQMGGFAPYDAMNEVYKLYLRAQETKDPEKRQNHMNQMAYRLIELGIQGKIPVSNIARMVENIEKAGTAKTDEEVILRLLNYSNYMIERGKPEPVKPLTKKEYEEFIKKREEGKKDRTGRDDRKRGDRTRKDRFRR